MYLIILLKTKFITYNSISNNILIYIVNNSKLNTINKNTITLNKILLDSTTIIINLIYILYILKLLIDLLSINILINIDKSK